MPTKPSRVNKKPLRWWSIGCWNNCLRISHRWLERLNNFYLLRRERALRRQELAESLREQPPVRFCQLEPRRVLNASFDLAGPNLNLLNFTAGTNLDVSHSSLTNSYEFALSSGTWQDSLGADTGSNLLVVLDSVLTGTLSVDSALATDISLSSNLGTLDQVLLSTQGAVNDAPGTQLQTNGALSITAGTVLIGEQLTDSYQLGELNLDTQGLTEVHAVGNLVVAGADSTNDITLFADSLELQNVAIDGSLSAQSRTGDILVGSLVTDGDIFLTAQGGSILDAQDDVLIDLDAGGVINLTADQHILAFGVDQFLEVADGNRVTARSLVGGNIQLQSLGSLELTQLITADGNMTIRADGALSAMDVDSSTTDSAANFINLTATGPNGNLEIHRVVAGTQNARVSLIAAGDVLDGDSVADDLDVSAKTVSIHAQTGSVGQQVGVNGSVFQETYQATAGVEILWTDSLTINAGTSAILNPTLGTGVATLNSVNTVVISNDDLDVSNIDVSGSTNVALIADADQSGSGNLKLAGNVSVSGDLRIQGADVVSALPLSFNASRFMLISGQAESFTINSFIPNSLVDLDSRVFGDLIVASQSDLRLVDLNGDNFSVSSITGSVVVVTDAGAIDQLSNVASTKNLLLRASEDLISSASIVASGNLSMIAGDDVQLKSLVQTTSGGTVFIEAGNSKADGPDGILMSANSKILTAHRNAHLSAGNDGNITVQSIDVGKGSLSLVAEGSILGATSSHFLIANALRLEADAVVNSNRNGLGSIGLANTTNGIPNANSLAIHTQVSRLSAISAEGIYLVNTGSVVVGTVDSVVVQRVNRDGTLSQNVDRSLSDLTTTNGPIKLQTIDGGIRVTDGNANSQNGGNNIGVSTQAGDVLLQALGLNATITIDSAVRTQGGAIHVAADLNILQNSDLLVAGGVNNPARNSVVVDSLNGSIVMSGTALTSTQDGNIVYSSANDTTLGQLTAGLGSVAVVAGGSILDGQLDTVSSLNGFAIQTGQAQVVNIQAASSSLRSAGIGVAGNALDVEVNQIAVSVLGSAYLYETNGLVVGSVGVIDATRVHLNSTTAKLSIARLDGAVSTNGHVKMETQLGNLEIASAVTAQQDVLLVSGSENVVINDIVQAQTGAISILAGADILQNSNVQIVTSSDPISNSINARALNGSISMSPSAFSRTAAGNIVYQAAQSITLGQLNTTTGSVALLAGGVITDSQQDLVQLDQSTGFAIPIGVARVENVIANSLSIQAIRVGANSNPIDINAQLLAIAVQESASLLETNQVTIGSVPEVRVTQNHLDSTQQVRSISAVSGALASNGFFNLQSLDGSIVVDSNANAGVVGGQSRGVIASADVLIAAGGSGDLVIESSIISQLQDVWLAAGRFLVTPLLQVGGTQTAIVEADHLTAYAGANIFLPNTFIDTVEFKVVGGINVLAPQQLLNPFADQAGTLILDQLQHGPTNTNPNITTPSTPIATDSFQAWQDHFRFTERFSDGYTVFLRNVGSLTLQEKNFDRSLNVTGQQPGVYLETLKPVGLAKAPSDLVVSGKNTIVSTTTNQDPGIVLIADQDLVVQGSIELLTPLAIAAPKNQVLNQLALNASAYHAGLGDPQTVGPAGHSVPVTTEYVVDPIRSQTEDYRTHVNQRVLMEFGSIGESGFLTMVHYADNAFQVFQNQGEVSSLATPSEFALQPSQTNLKAIGNTTNDAALFTRSTDFTQVDRFFLQNNRDLPTDVVIRRSLDYFLFSNAQSSDPNQIIDHTSFAQEIVGVKSLGTPSLGPITPIPDGIAPPDPPTRGESALADRPLSLILPQIELKQVKSEAIEVAIFRIGYDDRNTNGQVETTELPAFDDVLNRVDLDSKLPISSKNAGQSPSQGEVDEVKARLLETPDQPSGAYAIIRKNADGKQEVLDVFSVRDWPEESKENGEVRDESDDETPKSPDDEQEDHDEQQSGAATSIGFENREDASQSSKPKSPMQPKESSSSAPTDESGATESTRIKDGAAVLCTLWLLHQTYGDPSGLTRKSVADSSLTSRDEGIDEVSFSRQDRLRRRAKSALAKIVNQPNTNQ